MNIRNIKEAVQDLVKNRNAGMYAFWAHRITGVVVTVFLFLHIWTLSAVFRGKDAYDYAISKLAAGIATLSILRRKGVYRDLETKGAYLAAGTAANLAKARVTAVQNRVGSLSCLFFTGAPVVDYASAKSADARKYARYFTGMLKGGVYLAPSHFEGAFISLAHTTDDQDRTLAVQRRVLRSL